MLRGAVAVLAGAALAVTGLGSTATATSRHADTATVAAVGTTSLHQQSAAARARHFAFQPISMQRIMLSRHVKSASFPEFTDDGHHLLFWSNSELWITSLHGRGVHCLSCGLANDPKLPDAAYLATPFPDGKRVFIDEDLQPPLSKMAVLECTPSLINCKTRTMLPVDFSRAEPAVLPPGGAISTPQETLVGGAYHAKLSQDGRYVGFSELRSDTIEAMVVARLKRGSTQYVVTNPRVINPPAPTSSSDRNIAHWSDSSGLFELKTFTHGGADATYVQVGGPSLMNPDVWSVNLKTGRRTRLTASPDWEEDDGVSPNGKLLSVYSQQTMHYVDWMGGLMPVRDFIDATASTFSSTALGGNSECMGPMWLMPSSGDDNAALAGEPLVDYRYPHVHVVRSYTGSSQWSPNGTMIALDAVDDATGNAPPYLLVAHLTALKPSHPLRPVSSKPGRWAPGPKNYHGPMAYVGTITLHGPHGGTVTVHYGGTAGALAGAWSETYSHYSDNGRDFLTGSVAISGTAAAGQYKSQLTMTGADTGSDSANLSMGENGISGHAVDSYDGKTITGPPASEKGNEATGGPSTACPKAWPREPALHTTIKRLGHSRYRMRVTASIAGVGVNEKLVDTQPVKRARITIGHRHVRTNNAGVAIITVRHRHKMSVRAGDTLRPTHRDIGPRTHRPR
jgi:hypothetical protein